MTSTNPGGTPPPIPSFGGLPGLAPPAMPTFGAVPGAGASVEHRLAPLKQAIIAGMPDAAMPELTRLLEEHPQNAAVQMAMAAAWMMKGDGDRAIPYAREAIRFGENDGFVLRNAGMLLAEAELHDEALPALRRAIELDPQDTASSVRIAQTLFKTHRAGEALKILEPLRSWKPHESPSVTMHASILLAAGRASEAGALAAEQVNRDPLHIGVAAVAANACNYAERIDPSAAMQIHRHMGRLVTQLATQARAGHSMVNYTGSKDPLRRIRLGILSSELRRHSVAYFIEPLLRHLDRQHFEIIVYATGPDDADSKRMRAFADVWTAAAGADDVSVAEHISRDMVDILIETSGYTEGHRLGVMAQRPAPIQLTYCGYPHSLGMPAVHHRLVDWTTDPTGVDVFAGENLARINDCFLCYRPPAEAPEVRPRDPGKPLVFGSFNNPAKISPTTLALWQRALAAAPGSRLVLKAKALDDPWIRGEVLSRAAAAGIAAGTGPGQVEVIPSTPGLVEHLECYGLIDVALDTFPYNGTTTTCEALWMGVPVVSLSGQTHASRVGASLLKAAGMGHWSCSSVSELEERARVLASGRAELAKVRSSLREHMRTSLLCDGPDFARRLSDVLREMWRQWCMAPY